MTEHTGGARPPKWKLAAAYLIVYIIWGSTYLGIRFTVETIPPILSGGMRFMAAGALLFGVRFIATRRMPPKASWKRAFLSSLLPFVVSYGLITTAEVMVPSSIAALISALEPLWFCLIGWLIFHGDKPKPRHYAGLALGIAGVTVLIVFDPNASLSFKGGYTFWMLTIVFSSLMWVTGAFIASSSKIREDTLTASGMQMLCGGLVMLAAQFSYSAVTGNWPQFGAFSFRSVAALAYLVVFGSIVAYSSFLWLMRVEPAHRVSTHAFVNPIVAVFLGWLIGSEAIHINTLIALPLISLSVLLMVWDKKPEKD